MALSLNGLKITDKALH